MKKPESFVIERLSNHLIMKHDNIPFRFDLFADLKMSIYQAKKLHKLHGAKFSKGYPDLFIATGRGGYGGLYLEVKKDMDKLPNTAHIKTQARFHAVLRYNGYKCMFCLGYKECKKIIKKYLKMKLNCVK